jgi:isopentenyl-diphosphate delta-isomerase
VAAERRLYEECGLQVALEFVFKFEYSALFGKAGAEHELCSVFIGVTNSSPIINTTEVSSFQWQKPSLLDQKIENQPHIYTPWFKTEWAKLRTEFSDRLPQIDTIPS